MPGEQRRRAQNRASQRAYRERKDQRIRDLEQLLGEAKQRNDTLSHAYAELHAEYVKLKTTQAFDSYSAVALGSTGGGGGGGGGGGDAATAYFDPTLAAGLQGGTAGAAGVGRNSIEDRLDLDLFVYPDLAGGYSL